MIKKNKRNTNMLFAFCATKNTDVINLLFSGASMRIQKKLYSKLLSEYLFKSNENASMFLAIAFPI